MKKYYFFILSGLAVGCQKQTETVDTFDYQDSLQTTSFNSDGSNPTDSISFIEVPHELKTKYAVVWAIIAPKEDSELVADSIHRYQSIGSEVIELQNYNEDAKYREMDKFEKTLYDDGAVPFGMDIKKRNILVFDTYAEASKKREEFIK